MSQSFWCVGIGAIAVTAFASFSFGADTTSTFDANDEGWVVAGTFPTEHITDTGAIAPPAWDDAEGQPPGSVRIGDVFPWTWIIAPSSWLGDWSSSFGGQISFDILIRITDGVPYPALALRGQNITLYYNNPSPEVSVWTTISAPLVGAGWLVNSYAGGAVATDAQMLEVLSNLQGIYLMTEWNTGSDDTSVDNVFMTGTPAPTCPGDVNGDGLTNVADFNILAGNFGTSVTPNTSGDLTGDGLVNVADFNILAGDYGCT